jgi:hypothetical protein
VSLEFWLCVAITAISAYVGLGYSIAGLRGADPRSQAGFMYALARSAALAVAATIAPFTSSIGFVAAVAVVMVLVQGADAVVGLRIRDSLKTYGPAATAVANAVALVWMVTTH